MAEIDEKMRRKMTQLAETGLFSAGRLQELEDWLAQAVEYEGQAAFEQAAELYRQIAENIRTAMGSAPETAQPLLDALAEFWSAKADVTRYQVYTATPTTAQTAVPQDAFLSRAITGAVPYPDADTLSRESSSRVEPVIDITQMVRPPQKIHWSAGLIQQVQTTRPASLSRDMLGKVARSIASITPTGQSASRQLNYGTTEEPNTESMTPTIPDHQRNRRSGAFGKKKGAS